ncbi:diguanylate cyclase [Zavarzinia sp. CC-PAN008]|uniref:diguanylate cyclase n=1 Tax=Zavarzinia sp. CC-PAN008 TaxID=3243332 RepID=UPI003F7463E9
MTFVLPDPAEPTDGIGRAALLQHSRRLLLVEDSRFFSNVVAERIEREIGLDVVKATTFAEARALVEADGARFFMAVVDLVLPDSQDGEAAVHLASQGVPSIVFTSRYSDDMRERLISYNVLDYVVKDNPSSLSYLVDLIGRLYRHQGETVLLVDDSAVARQHTMSFLRTYQLNVIEAKNGREGLAQLEAHPEVRLVITDYHMPDMDGIEMIKAMRRTHDHDRLAIIGVSSAGSRTVSARFLKNGANDFIIKPFLPEEFFCRIMQNFRMIDMAETMRVQASTDFLTGLHNRRFFFEAGAQLLDAKRRGGTPIAVAVMDIDGFKQVNDRHGHDTGDRVLRAVADTLRAALRSGDIVARYGGEEFAILAAGVKAADAPAFFERIREKVSATVVPGLPLRVTASFGVQCSQSLSLNAMLEAADRALYGAKSQGRDRVVVAG